MYGMDGTCLWDGQPKTTIKSFGLARGLAQKSSSILENCQGLLARKRKLSKTTEPRQFQSSFSGSVADSSRRHNRRTQRRLKTRRIIVLPPTPSSQGEQQGQVNSVVGQKLVSKTPSFICRNCGGRAALLSSSEMSNGSELLIESPFAFREG